ncbi:hypothetical protein WMY93_029557 [Mugilogobius chulae]|uniref:G-protein coupled receptors family 2 profile 2 domain-containing protein n=1 Tax=Mugilogobius chulae TaxID=88201 RepID=A0AAW0MK95_9GOBI
MTTVSPTQNVTAHLTTASMKNRTEGVLNVTTSSPTSFVSASDQTTANSTDNTTIITTKPQVNVTAEEVSTTPVINATTTAMSHLQTQESTPNITESSTSSTTESSTTSTIESNTTSTTESSTTSTTESYTIEASTTSLQTMTTSGTTNPDTGLIPTTTTEQTTRSQQELEQDADNLLAETADVSKLNSSQVEPFISTVNNELNLELCGSAGGSLGLKLVVSGENEILSSTSLVLAVQAVDGNAFSSTTANIFNTDNVQISARRARSTEAPLGSVFLPASLTEGLSPEEKNRTSRVQFTFTPRARFSCCNHLTSFAVLLDFSREGITDPVQAQLLTFITYIGCGISAVFLSFTIVTYLLFEKLLRDIPAKILVQLCISLLLLNLLFLVDGWLALFTANGLCISTAFFLHYFLLTSFTWTGLRLCTCTSVSSVSSLRTSANTCEVFPHGLGCWLRNDLAFYIGVVAYFLLIFLFCLIVFVVVMAQLARIKRQNPQNQNPNRGVLADLRSVSGLIILLGLTWGFALFAWGPLYLPFVYLFTIFNSLQGFFIFVFHCAIKENVQRQWRTYLCCGNLRLPENSDWSRTATHNHKNSSFARMSSSAAHLTSSSTSVVSDINSSGSVYADSGISDGSNSDVVLNELHRRNMTHQDHL